MTSTFKTLGRERSRMDGSSGRMSVQFLLGDADGFAGPSQADISQASSLPYHARGPHRLGNTYHQHHELPPFRSESDVPFKGLHFESRRVAACEVEPLKTGSRFPQEAPNLVQCSSHHSSQTYDRSRVSTRMLSTSKPTLQLPPASSLTTAARIHNTGLTSARSNLYEYERVVKKPPFKRERISNRSKRMWTAEEDELLRTIAGDFPENWNMIGVNLPGRTGKQCRERWLNNLRPNIRKGGWSREEDELILQEQALRGNQWSAIARMLPGRSDNAVKNRYNATLRKYSARVSQMAIIEAESSTVDSPTGSDTM